MPEETILQLLPHLAHARNLLPTRHRFAAELVDRGLVSFGKRCAKEFRKDLWIGHQSIVDRLSRAYVP